MRTGGQVNDIHNDEPDGLDETWALYDRELVDDELYALVTFPARRANLHFVGQLP
jgi:metacaspase-1